MATQFPSESLHRRFARRGVEVVCAPRDWQGIRPSFGKSSSLMHVRLLMQPGSNKVWERKMFKKHAGVFVLIFDSA